MFFFPPAVTCAVMQKTGAGLHTANSCYWDTTMDGKEECFLHKRLNQIELLTLWHNWTYEISSLNMSRYSLSRKKENSNQSDFQYPRWRERVEATARV